MKEIASAISEGARAFLTAEYKILIVFVIVLFLLIGFGIGKLGNSNLFCCGSFVFYTGRLLWHECCNKGECKNSECCQRKWNE